MSEQKENGGGTWLLAGSYGVVDVGITLMDLLLMKKVPSVAQSVALLQFNLASKKMADA